MNYAQRVSSDVVIYLDERRHVSNKVKETVEEM